ncbi:hypothetical protein HU200_052772 [Digitaria exilis]|uniref:Peptidase A1 domain-containing protein n=1 Tax=Digitaria exilis TaxID=1010633 RepID=A0A835E945_9POAL|nr:hypothetical protein HU200_052772 [Digitaria exilis]
MARPLLWLVLLCASSLTSFAARAAGLRLALTHVDAKANLSVEERMHRRLASMAGGVAAPLHWAGNQYIAEYLIGNPPQKAEAVVAIGSDLFWTQCSSCSPVCFKQDLSVYDPSMSSTYRAVACTDAACAMSLTGGETQCSVKGTECSVLATYGGGVAAGDLAVEEFTFGEEVASLAFGCIGASTLKATSLEGSSGVIGLGRGALSVVSQLAAGDTTTTRFSYCLGPYFHGAAVNQSHLFVGASAATGLTGADTPVTTVPFVTNPNDEPYTTYYYLPLVGITVGKTRLDGVPAAAFELREVTPGKWAGTMIDSAYPFMSLVDVAHQALKAELAAQLGASLVPPPEKVSKRLELCVARGEVATVVPPLVLHFAGAGGDVVVPPENYWAPVDEVTACMLVFSAAQPNAKLPMSETTVIGNFMQQNMYLLYDLGNGVLSFQPADCSSM